MTLFINKVAEHTKLNPLELKRFVKFAVVGVIGAVVDFGVGNILLNPIKTLFFNTFTPAFPVEGVLRWSAVTVGTIAFLLAIISNFFWNRYWTYPDSRSKSFHRQFTQFFVINLSGLLIRVPVIAFLKLPLTDLAERLNLPMEPSRMGYNLATAFAVGIVMFWNFFVNRKITYNDVA